MREILHDELQNAEGGQPLFAVRGLMEIEFELARRDALDLVLLHVEVDGLARVAPTPERERAVYSGLLALLRAVPRAGDLLVYKDGARVVVLFSRTSLEAGEQACRALIEGAKKLALSGDAHPLRVSLAIGIAALRHDQELDYETLVHVADDGLEVALNSGAECCVHTELYGLYQKKIDRERPQKKARVELHTATAPASATAGQTSDGVLFPHARTAPAPASDGTHAVQPGQPASAATPPAAELDERVRSALAHAAQGSTTVESLEAKLKELAHQWAEDELKRSLAAQAAEHQQEKELLERRIAKLSRTLETTEEELRTLADQKDADPGVASAYRGVQGLSSREQHYQAKLALLSQLLAENLELRRQIQPAQ